jgi:hypothetical protein
VEDYVQQKKVASDNAQTKWWHQRADDSGGRMMESCCQVIVFIKYLSFMNVSFVMCGVLELYYPFA